MTAYYNENDPYVAQWLRNLIAAGHIAAGDVDERSIVDVRPADLAGYAQCHFFAGIAGWSLALRMARWPDDRPVWTGSCPCQPFSQAGKRKGFADERHLWPEWFRLIRECHPATVLGEQVARAAAWLALVRGDLEAVGYAVGAMPVEAASVGANHRRDRLWFVAHADERGWPQRQGNGSAMGYGHSVAAGGGDVANANGHYGYGRSSIVQMGRGRITSEAENNGQPVRTQWSIEPGVGRVAHGVPARVAKLRALGNAIVPQCAAEFIRAAIDSLAEPEQR
jgi:DNA (cytosine-5)-methyltransferase 1